MRTGIFVAAAVLLAIPALAVADPLPIGQIKTLAGEASVERAGKRLAAVTGNPVYLNDTVATAPGGAIGITLKDGTTLSLGEASRLTLDDFVYDPGQDKVGMNLGLAKGTLAYVSGRIAAVAPASVAVRTPMATIGIRGTRFVVKAEEE
ncbi:MAG: FecR family protein [Magnetospirillum sp. WYHS-4]